jgi:hypothetical protein
VDKQGFGDEASICLQGINKTSINYPEDGGSNFLQNVYKHPTSLHSVPPRKTIILTVTPVRISDLNFLAVHKQTTKNICEDIEDNPVLSCVT